MATNYDVLNYTVNVLVDKLMSKYDTSYDSAIDVVLNSDLYVRLLSDEHFLEEGDIYLFNVLEDELKAKGVISVIEG